MLSVSTFLRAGFTRQPEANALWEADSAVVLNNLSVSAAVMVVSFAVWFNT